MTLSDTLTANERMPFYQAIAALDPSKSIVICDSAADTLSYSAAVHSTEKITGRPNDEELVRALLLLHLINTYSYVLDTISLETRTPKAKGITSRETDICIYKTVADRIATKHCDILCEIKSPQKYSAQKEKAIQQQLFAPYIEATRFNSCRYLCYLTFDIPQDKQHNAIRCIGISTDLHKNHESWAAKGSLPDFVDFPVSGAKAAPFLGYIKGGARDLNTHFDIKLLRRSWTSIWNQIWGGTVEDNAKFEHFNKLVLAKIFDERTISKGEAYRFQVKTIAGREQSAEELALDIDLLYRRAYQTYISRDTTSPLFSVPGLDFNKLSHNVVFECVKELSEYSFINNRLANVDVLGEFYELVIRESFKQTKGLFLTHPNIVLFLIAASSIEDLIDAALLKGNGDPRFRLPFIIDPSCGTGTFLIFVMRYVQRYLEKHSARLKKGGNVDLVDFLERHVEGIHQYKWARDYLYGVDREAMLAVATQINLILHGDGSSNVYALNALSPLKQFGNISVPGATNLLAAKAAEPCAYYERTALNQFDLLISNPPFSAPLDLKPSDVRETFVSSSTSEGTFLERWYQLLKPNGRLAVVLPESMFSVAENELDRLFLYRHFNIHAIVSLPSHTFSPHTMTSTCLLLAQKKTSQQEDAFSKAWDGAVAKFHEVSAAVLATLPRASEVDFVSREGKGGERSILKIHAEAEDKARHLLGSERVIPAYRTEAWLFDPENYARLRAEFRGLLEDAMPSWCFDFVLTKLHNGAPQEFDNYSVTDVGYKNGKKGSKDRPNELLKLVVPSKPGMAIYNIKKAEDVFDIECDADGTVLALLRKNVAWQ